MAEVFLPKAEATKDNEGERSRLVITRLAIGTWNPSFDRYTKISGLAVAIVPN
jgi:hypothetical protein